MPNATLNKLTDRIGQVKDVQAALGLLHWDQEVYMPPKAAPARGKQLATLSGIAHELFTEAETGDLLDRLADDASLNDDERKLVTETQYDYARATKLPEDFVRAFSEETSKGYEAWVKAKEATDFSIFQPHLATIVDLCRQRADLLGYEGSPYNALLEDYERGIDASQLRTLFTELAEKQSALVQRIVDSGNQPDTAWLDCEWDSDRQWAFTMRLLEDMGYDLEAGRQDKSIHPFTTEFDLYDVRVTTAVNPKNPFDAIMASIHEGGHALYEQGFLDSDHRTTLGECISLGIHESQSRMWEIIIGQSKPFWDHYGDIFREHFPEELASVSNDDIYRGVNRVRPTLRRLDADECTYNLHIILRFEMELALIEGDINAADVPTLWAEKMQSYLGLEVPDDSLGCTQDIHWSHGSFGYFPTYALGNLYAAQFYETILADLPDLPEKIGQGDFCSVLGWLRTNIHQIGRRKLAAELIEDVTGNPPSAQPFLSYLETKYGALYGL